MARRGQDSPRAALMYQHACHQVDQTIADKLGRLSRASAAQCVIEMATMKTARAALCHSFAIDRRV